MKNAVFCNRELPKTVKAGDVIRVQLAPFGDFPHPNGMQHCDREAFEKIVATWEESGKPEILVDFDHASETGGPTEAAAWAFNLAVEDEGLFADFRLTDKGADALSATRYRYLSPCWYVTEDGHPCELLSVGLTNRPNLPVARLLNAKPAPGETKPEHKETNTMDKLRELLGLAAEATDEEVLAAVSALREEADALKAEKAEREEAEKAALLDAEADKCVEEHKDQIENAAAVKEAFKANPDGTKALLNALKKPAPAPTSKPKIDFNSGKPPADEKILANCKTPEEMIEWAKAHG